jgi:hypothetical protein
LGPAGFRPLAAARPLDIVKTLKRCHRLRSRVGLPLAAIDARERVVGLGVVAVARRRMLQRGDRLVQVILLFEQHAELIVRLGGGRVVANRLAQQRLGLSQLTARA